MNPRRRRSMRLRKKIRVWVATRIVPTVAELARLPIGGETGVVEPCKVFVRIPSPGAYYQFERTP